MAELIDRLNAALAGRYAIQRELGAGGMATVFLAEDLKHHRSVAIKVLRRAPRLRHLCARGDYFHPPHRSATCAVIASLVGGFSPRPSVCRNS